ncbi:hypothetical protein COB64_02260 [Candidatus Wolfebacteria bacterium]|nr:MAG: hypothetical protein COB64_02260 [Candidatus Wolfebacteria bacterium]
MKNILPLFFILVCLVLLFIYHAGGSFEEIVENYTRNRRMISFPSVTIVPFIFGTISQIISELYFLVTNQKSKKPPYGGFFISLF